MGEAQLTLGRIPPGVGARLAEEVAPLPKQLRIGLLPLRHRLPGEGDDEVREVVHMDVVPLGAPRADDGGEALAEGEPHHVVDLDGARVAGPAAGAEDARWAHYGGLDGGGRGAQDDLVDVAVDGVVRHGGCDLDDVGDVVVLLVRVGRLALTFLLDVALWRGCTRSGQVRGVWGAGGGGVEEGEMRW